MGQNMEKIYKKDIDKVMPILQALEKGKTIQFAALVNEWVDLDGDKDGLLLETLINNPQAFRVKPESKYYPFANAEECWNEMQKHQPFGWVKDKKDGHYALVTSVLTDEKEVYIDGISGLNLYTVINYYTFADGTPFGVKVEE